MTRKPDLLFVPAPMKHCLAILSILLFWPGLRGQHGFDRVPIRLVDNLIFIEVFVNDSKHPSMFLFDTGAGITVVDSQLAEALRLPRTDTVNIGTSGKTLRSEVSEGQLLQIGSAIQLDGISLAVMDLSHLSKYLKTRVDGIIGYDLLAATILETNIDSLEMRFYPDASKALAENAQAYELLALESNHLGLPIAIIPDGGTEGLSLIVKIDTAAGNYLTFHHAAVTGYGLANPKKRYRTRKGFGADATITRNLDGRVASVVFAGKKWTNVPAVFEVDPLNRSSQRLADGLIGQKILLEFNITYNLKEGIVYLEERN